MRNAKHHAFTPSHPGGTRPARLATPGRNRSSLSLVGSAMTCGAFDMSTEAERQHRNEQFELLLNLTSGITSSLDLRVVLRSIAANIREVIHADAAAVFLPDAATGRYRVFAMDFPHGKGVIKEELFFTPSAAGKRAMDTLKPVVIDTREPGEFVAGTTEIAAAEGLKALCIIPLVNRGRVLGFLAPGRTTETPFMP